jgi:hypothetical protein
LLNGGASDPIDSIKSTGENNADLSHKPIS